MKKLALISTCLVVVAVGVLTWSKKEAKVEAPTKTEKKMVKNELTRETNQNNSIPTSPKVDIIPKKEIKPEKRLPLAFEGDIVIDSSLEANLMGEIYQRVPKPKVIKTLSFESEDEIKKCFKTLKRSPNLHSLTEKIFEKSSKRIEAITSENITVRKENGDIHILAIAIEFAPDTKKPFVKATLLHKTSNYEVGDIPDFLPLPEEFHSNRKEYIKSFMNSGELISHELNASLYSKEAGEVDISMTNGQIVKLEAPGVNTAAGSLSCSITDGRDACSCSI